MRVVLREGALRAVCDHLGISRSALARRLGVEASTLYRLETGVTPHPSERLIAGLLAVAGLAFADLFEVVHDNKH